MYRLSVSNPYHLKVLQIYNFQKGHGYVIKYTIPHRQRLTEYYRLPRASGIKRTWRCGTKMEADYYSIFLANIKIKILVH